MRIKTNSAGAVLCGYFSTCQSPAVGTVDNAALGPVPTCKRCATVVGATLTECEVELLK